MQSQPKPAPDVQDAVQTEPSDLAPLDTQTADLLETCADLSDTRHAALIEIARKTS